MVRAALLALVALSLVGCDDVENGPDGPEPAGEEVVEINGELANDRGIYEVTDFEKVPLDAGDFYFEPTIIAGVGGLELELHLVTESETTHNLTIPELGIDDDVTQGDIIGNIVTIPETGTITFFCKYHRDQGMIGGLQAVT